MIETPILTQPMSRRDYEGVWKINSTLLDISIIFWYNRINIHNKNYNRQYVLFITADYNLRENAIFFIYNEKWDVSNLLVIRE